MTYILSIETSTPVCSVAIHKDGELLAKTIIKKGHSHSSLLNSTIENLLNLTDLRLADMDAFAIAKGPGSYTGLRIATSTVKGFCYATKKPLIAINTLLAMAKGMSKFAKDILLCPMLDARRMEVYTLTTKPDLDIVEDTRPVILDENSFAELLDHQKVMFFGDGSDKFENILKNQNAMFIPGVTPDAEYVGELAWSSFQNNRFENLAYFEPFYLKEFRATKPKLLL